MITAAVLFNSHLTFGTLLSVGCDPIGCLAVVVALLLPLPEEITLNRLVPTLAAQETMPTNVKC
jgi:hypothetical protein